MPAQKPDTQRRSPTPYALQVRLTKAQYAYLLLFADSAGSMGAALRQVLDEKIDNTPLRNEGLPEGHPGEIASRSCRWVLEHADLDNLDQDELAQLLARDEE